MNREEQLMMEMFSKSKEEAEEMFNSGIFNEIVKGYMAMFLKEEHGGIFGKEAIKIAMHDMDRLFDEVTANEARTFYKNF